LGTRLSEIESERTALSALVRQVSSGGLNARQLAAFPSLLRAPAINSILTQLTTLETERTRLRESRTDRDPTLVALSASIADLEGQLLPLARTYNQSLDREAASVGGDQAKLDAGLAALPGNAESALRRQRDVRRLSQTVLGLQAQILDARLAAIAEGGQVRAVDRAVASKRQRFPRPPVVLLAGLVLGGGLGSLAALVRSALSRRVTSDGDAERSAGLPAIQLGGARTGGALVLGPLVRGGTLLVIPVDQAATGEARRVAAQVTALALEHGLRVQGVDAIDDGVLPVGALAQRVAAAERTAEARVVLTPPLGEVRALALLDPDRPVLAVARAGQSSRAAVRHAADVLARAGAPVVGVAVVATDWSDARDLAPWIAATAAGHAGTGASANGASGNGTHSAAAAV
jgi:hypothetical protein